MVRRYDSRRQSIPPAQQNLLTEEITQQDALELRLLHQIAEVFQQGDAYFRGLPLRPRDFANAFAPSLQAMATRILPLLYPHFSDVAISDTELNQLLEPTISGPSTKFLENGLGLLALDAGRYVPTCSGAEPSRILQFIIEQGGASGATIIAHFGRPPYGYGADAVRACLAGLLRGGKIRIRPEEGPEITSIKDPGTKDLFRRDRDLRRSDIFPPKDQAITARDRVAICSFFKRHMDLDLDRENDAIADAVFQSFPRRREALRDVERALDRLPGRPPLPDALQKLGRALEDCCRSRQVEEIVVAVKRHLDALSDGMEQLGIYGGELTESGIHTVRDAASVRDHQLAQLRNVGALGEVEAEAARLTDELVSERPWRAQAALSVASEQVRKRYVEVRRALLNAQGGEAEAARGRIKVRPGFERLSADEAHRVLRPITEALFDTTAEATAPTLVELRDGSVRRLREAEDRANDLLDDLLSRHDAPAPGKAPKAPPTPVVKVEARLQGREIATKDQLEAVLGELRERVLAQLEKGARVRLT